MRALISILLLLFGGVACTKAHQEASAPSRLYFAVEVHRNGEVIAQPRLLGEEGVTLRAERRPVGASASDYVLRLRPVRNGGVYEIDVDLALPGANAHRELSLLHGEVRRLELGSVPGELSLQLLLMEVDSPEFRALMQLGNEGPAVGGAGAI